MTAPQRRAPEPARGGQRALRRFVASERGAAVVEFAIVVPILLTLVMGIIDFGRMYAVAASLAAAVRDGARLGATSTDLTSGTQVNAVKDRVVAEFQPLGGAPLRPGHVSVALDAQGYVVVTVTGYAYEPITPIASLIGMGRVALDRTAAFRWERTS